jgi:hypothetical protein
MIVDKAIFHKHGVTANFYSAFPFVFGRLFSQLPQVCKLPSLYLV